MFCIWPLLCRVNGCTSTLKSHESLGFRQAGAQLAGQSGKIVNGSAANSEPQHQTLNMALRFIMISDNKYAT